jgi:hypothetical protein
LAVVSERVEGEINSLVTDLEGRSGVNSSWLLSSGGGLGVARSLLLARELESIFHRHRETQDSLRQVIVVISSYSNLVRIPLTLYNWLHS